MNLQSHSWAYNCRKLIGKDTCAPMFTALFTTAKTWKQPHVHWMVKDVYTHTHTHTMDYLLSHKKEWNNACSNMDGSRDYHTKWSQSQRDKYHVMSLVESNFKKPMNLFTKQIYRYWIENKLVTKGQRGWGGGVSQSCPTLQPHGLQPARLLCPRDFPGKKNGLGCHSLLQGIFLTQGLNLGLLHCRQILYHLSQWWGA